MLVTHDERIPIGEALAGVKVHPLDAKETVVSAFVLLKLIDADGDATWAYRTSEAPNREELLGALQVQIDILRQELAEEWEDDDED